MAGSSVFEVMDAFSGLLASRMPPIPADQQLEGTPGSVEVYQSHPGDVADAPALVWFDDLEETHETPYQKAGRKRRNIQHEWSIFIGVEFRGDTTGTEGRRLQRRVDEYGSEIQRTIEEAIADDPQFGAPSHVDWGVIRRTRRRRGMTATGAGLQIEVEVEWHEQAQ